MLVQKGQRLTTNHRKKGEQQENELMKVHAFVFILNAVSHRNYLERLDCMSNLSIKKCMENMIVT
jgi:hypothetical protein